MEIPSTKDEAFEAVVALAVEGLRIQQQLKAFDDLKARQADLGNIAGWYLTHPLLEGVSMGDIVSTAQLLLDNEVKDQEPASAPELTSEPQEKPKRRRRTKAQIEADKAAEEAAKAGQQGEETVTATTQESGELVKDDVPPQTDEEADAAWAQADPAVSTSGAHGEEPYDPFAAAGASPSMGADGTALDPFATPAPVQAGAPAPWESQPAPSGPPIGSPFD